MNRFTKKLIVSAMVLAAASAHAQNRGLAPITPEQSARIRAAARPSVEGKELSQAIAEAASTIEQFLRINSCLSGYDASALNAFAAPGKIYPNNNYIGGPIPMMRRHDKHSCVDVVRVHGWSMPGSNSLRFEVVYVSASSGESAKSSHEVHKQPEGTWLFAR
jgi:hypothetical protein